MPLDPKDYGFKSKTTKKSSKKRTATTARSYAERVSDRGTLLGAQREAEVRNRVHEIQRGRPPEKVKYATAYLGDGTSVRYPDTRIRVHDPVHAYHPTRGSSHTMLVEDIDRNFIGWIDIDDVSRQ